VVRDPAGALRDPPRCGRAACSSRRRLRVAHLAPHVAVRRRAAHGAGARRLAADFISRVARHALETLLSVVWRRGGFDCCPWARIPRARAGGRAQRTARCGDAGRRQALARVALHLGCRSIVARRLRA
jgi:hypothetical protein